LLLLPASWALRGAMGLDDSELLVGMLAFHAAHVVNDPHFAVTYLLFYRDGARRAFDNRIATAQRFRYVLAGFVAPLVLGVWGIGAAATGSASTLGWMIQLMFFLVGWHYTKQGFGVMMVLSARRGVRYSTLERRLLLAHCLSAWAYAWSSPADPGRDVVETGVLYRSLAQPALLETVTLVAFAASGLALITVLGRKWYREPAARAYVPLIGLLVSVWLWTVFSHVDPLVAYVIPLLHSLQYLYFVALLRGNEARAEQGPPDFRAPPWVRLAMLYGAALALGFLLLRQGPAWLDGVFVLSDVDDPSRVIGVGPTPYLAAFVTFVNVHHYLMDAVIWRRDNPDTRYLRG